MPFKSKETAWVYLVISFIAFWFKGGLVLILLLWTWFFVVDLPRDLKEFERYKKYLEEEKKPKAKKRRNNDEPDMFKLPSEEEIEQGRKKYLEDLEEFRKKCMINVDDD